MPTFACGTNNFPLHTLLRPNKKISVFLVTGLQILDGVDTHIFFIFFFLEDSLCILKGILPYCRVTINTGQVFFIRPYLEAWMCDYLVLAISTGMDAAVVTSPLIILAQKWRIIPSWNQPEINMRL